MACCVALVVSLQCLYFTKLVVRLLHPELRKHAAVEREWLFETAMVRLVPERGTHAGRTDANRWRGSALRRELHGADKSGWCWHTRPRRAQTVQLGTRACQDELGQTG